MRSIQIIIFDAEERNIAKHLIIGATGFMGRHVAAALLREERPIVVASRHPPPLPPGANSRLVEYRPFDLIRADWASLVAGCAVVHHYAWSSLPSTAVLDPAGDLDLNVRSTLDLLEAMRRHGGQRLIFASSGGTVYGRFEGRPALEDDRPCPVSAYGVGKLTAEHYVRVYRLEHGVDGRIARLSNPFGAGQGVRRNFGAISHFVRKALAREAIEIWGDGETVRDYAYVRDVERALIAFADCDVPEGEAPILNIGSGNGTSLNDLVSVIENVLGRPLEVSYMPGRKFDVPYNVLDTRRAYKMLGWACNVPLAMGIERLIADIRDGTETYARD